MAPSPILDEPCNSMRCCTWLVHVPVRKSAGSCVVQTTERARLAAPLKNVSLHHGAGVEADHRVAMSTAAGVTLMRCIIYR